MAELPRGRRTGPGSIAPAHPAKPVTIGDQFEWSVRCQGPETFSSRNTVHTMDRQHFGGHSNLRRSYLGLAQLTQRPPPPQPPLHLEGGGRGRRL